MIWDFWWFGMTGVGMTIMPTAHSSLPNIWDDLEWFGMIWDDHDAHSPQLITQLHWHCALIDHLCTLHSLILRRGHVFLSTLFILTPPFRKIQGMIRDQAQKAWNRRIFTPLINLGHGHQHRSPPSPSPPPLLVLFPPMKWILCVVQTNDILVLVLLRCVEKTLIALLGR